GAGRVRGHEEPALLEAAAELQRRPGRGRIGEAIDVYDPGPGRHVTELGARGARAAAIPAAKVQAVSPRGGPRHLERVGAIHRPADIEHAAAQGTAHVRARAVDG